MTVLSANAAGRQVVYGASDDLLEFRGPITDELDCWDAGVQRLTFSTGVVLEVELGPDEPLWAVRVVSAAGQPTGVELVPARERADEGPRPDGPANDGDDEDGCPSYSDKAVLDLPAGATVEVVRL